MILHVHPEDPQPRLIKQIVESLQKGGIIIYPTDTVYGLGCDILQQKAVERICRIKQVEPKKAQLSFVCSDLSHLSDYTKPIPNSVYRTLKEYLPGPYTFILQASKLVPKILQSKKDTIGLRIPNNNIAMAIVKELGRPILSASLPGEMVEDYTDPEVMYENFRNEVDFVVDGGIGGIKPSTVVDFTGDNPVLIREGLGLWQEQD
ncbi:MAG: threonylcarbamoyl-AMP synthase [Chitinophagaceae bacterium]|nr:threonylcarbamoyl-AMP synthase [Chitinophagaceae bacterium]MBK8607986.1 threonylcarbamoyl-AMP synthase [Chitinophagaceae bacterium]MBP6477274.1 threonylcarbamoyl-AMP synthase [Chitinophagaceae bacterium]MBP7108998.1 threonylcarbamoyl-AMP synthase [Chitinophagaceae bacterium]MBP7314487.1 threonylcarbamoyl-AMP synthase [Chitinophagaceae bacterium]